MASSGLCGKADCSRFRANDCGFNLVGGKCPGYDGPAPAVKPTPVKSDPEKTSDRWR